MSSPQPSPRLRTFLQDDFTASSLWDAKGHTSISVVIPARNEEGTIGRVVDAVLRCAHAGRSLADEVIVIDDLSSDATAAAARAAGADVFSTSDVLPGAASAPGKGQAMWKGLHVSKGDIVVFLDGDVTNCAPHFVSAMVGPLIVDPEIHLVKATYRRPLGGIDGEGGRVTELVAKPLIGALFPELAMIGQPLSGECGGRRALFESIPFPSGYGVEMGILIEVSRRFGASSIAQTDLGVRIHRNRPLSELGPIARAVTDVALASAGLATSGSEALLPPLALELTTAIG